MKQKTHIIFLFEHTNIKVAHSPQLKMGKVLIDKDLERNTQREDMTHEVQSKGNSPNLGGDKENQQQEKNFLCF